jgi:cytochrome c-type biogenesis protein CcmH
VKLFAGCILLLAQALWAPAVQAAIEEIEFASAEDRMRYERLVAELRCPKCLSGNIAGSDAPIAADLRAEVLKQINAGRSDDEIEDFMTERYGDFILYRPPLTLGTALLWFGPGLLLLAGLVTVRRMMRSTSSASEGGVDDATLSDEEQQRLAALLGKTKDSV